MVPAFLTILQRIKIKRNLAYVILSAILLQLYIQNRSIYLSWELSEAIEDIDFKLRDEQKFKWVSLSVSEDGKKEKMLPYIKNNLGMLNGIEPMHMDTAKFVKNNTELPLIIESFVSLDYWSPNELNLTLDTLASFTINQNFHPNWKEVDGNAEIVEVDGAMKIVPQAKSLHLKFYPPYLNSGLILSSVFLLGVLIWLGFLFRRG